MPAGILKPYIKEFIVRPTRAWSNRIITANMDTAAPQQIVEVDYFVTERAYHSPFFFFDFNSLYHCLLPLVTLLVYQSFYESIIWPGISNMLAHHTLTFDPITKLLTLGYDMACFFFTYRAHIPGFHLSSSPYIFDP